MSTFTVPVLPIRFLEPIPGADLIELAVIGEYRSVVKKGQFKANDLVAYIPEAAVVPKNLLEEMNLVGKLAGSQKDCVKAIKLRGCLSQGICYPARPEWVINQDVKDLLGIVKWEPPIPVQMRGLLYARHGWELKYDIENYKHYYDVIADGEEVVFTEKIHGTFTCCAVVPEQHPEHGDVIICSKGMGAKGYVYKPFELENQEKNIYVRSMNSHDIPRKIRHSKYYQEYKAVYVLGETFGRGVQDLGYGKNAGNNETIGFRAFDVFVGKPNHDGKYLDYDEFISFCDGLDIPRVPVLYRGPFSQEQMKKYTDGKETLSGRGEHVREGIVMRPVVERYVNELGRVQLKSVSGDYLTRKGETTEYE